MGENIEVPEVLKTPTYIGKKGAVDMEDLVLRLDHSGWLEQIGQSTFLKEIGKSPYFKIFITSRGEKSFEGGWLDPLGRGSVRGQITKNTIKFTTQYDKESIGVGAPLGIFNYKVSRKQLSFPYQDNRDRKIEFFIGTATYDPLKSMGKINPELVVIIDIEKYRRGLTAKV